MIESEHDNLTPQKGRARPVRLLLAITLTAGILYCQRGPAPYYEDTDNIPVSPEVHAIEP
jgi:hypothetical protein